MTYSEWMDLDLPIQWTISNDDESDDPVLNLDAPDGLPDGVYDGRTYWCDEDRKYRQKGIEIKDGKFVPKRTAYTIYRIMVGAYKLDTKERNWVPYCEETQEIHHYFMDGIEWNEKDQCFDLGMGS